MTTLRTPSSTCRGCVYASSRRSRYDICPAYPRSSQSRKSWIPLGVTAGATTNPHHPERTPGGSSSGSGAAVADFMVPLAFGTQTGGSVQRPSSYCGIVGYKPTFGLINPQGVKPAAESLRGGEVG